VRRPGEGGWHTTTRPWRVRLPRRTLAYRSEYHDAEGQQHGKRYGEDALHQPPPVRRMRLTPEQADLVVAAQPALGRANRLPALCLLCPTKLAPGDGRLLHLKDAGFAWHGFVCRKCAKSLGGGREHEG
jgi:hypothetical protein